MPTDLTKPAYIKEMQVARGLGILLVTFGHSEPVSEVFPALWNLIYSFHMPLFFFMSGFFSARLINRNWSREIVPSTLKLFIPYLVISISYGLIKFIVPALAKRPVVLSELPVDILFYPFHNPALFLWFLYILIFMRLISPLFRGNRAILLLPLSLLGACYYGNIDLFGIWGVLKYLVFFQSGLVLSHYQEQLFKLLASPVFLIAIMLLFALAYYFGRHVEAGPIPVGIAFLGISCALALSFSILFALRSEWVEYVGSRSLEIYLLQYYFIFPVLFALGKLSVPPPIIVGCTFIIGLCGPLLLYHVILKRVSVFRLLLTGR
ncbi:MAG: hypothetical protein D6B25_16410 [Desulfobulbaceae bacterium]|nr:MAG: hypothetical protein D6B25_16410 [Desulfobulbaceae bacterium]